MKKLYHLLFLILAICLPTMVLPSARPTAGKAAQAAKKKVAQPIARGKKVQSRVAAPKRPATAPVRGKQPIRAAGKKQPTREELMMAEANALATIFNAIIKEHKNVSAPIVKKMDAFNAKYGEEGMGYFRVLVQSSQEQKAKAEETAGAAGAAAAAAGGAVFAPKAPEVAPPLSPAQERKMMEQAEYFASALAQLPEDEPLEEPLASQYAEFAKKYGNPGEDQVRALRASMQPEGQAQAAEESEEEEGDEQHERDVKHEKKAEGPKLPPHVIERYQNAMRKNAVDIINVINLVQTRRQKLARVYR